MPAPISEEQNLADREQLLDAAEALFYEHGIQAVGMDAIRTRSQLPLKRIYAFFATKEQLVVATLQRRDHHWRASLANYVDEFDAPGLRVLAIFDWLELWFAEPGFRGCAWINAYGELGSSSPAILAEVRSHKQAFHDQIRALVGATGNTAPEPIVLLAEGAIVAAAITGDTSAARNARGAVQRLLGDAVSS